MSGLPTILIGEDHADSLSAFDIYFRSVGFDVDTAVTGRQVLQRVSLIPPDVLLLDLELPDLDGWEVTKEIRSTPASSDVPIVAITGHVYPAHRERASALGVDGFVAKPCPPDDLLVEVSRVLTARFAGRLQTTRVDLARSGQALQRLDAATRALLTLQARNREEAIKLRRKMVETLQSMKTTLAETRKARA
jgi:CheY-like chemotaxis protein